MDAIQSTSVLPRLQPAGTFRGGPSAPRAAAASSGAATPTGTAVTPSAGTLSESSFDALLYQSQMQRTSMMLRYAQAAAQAGDDASASEQQLEFEFAMESRTEQLALFRQRTTAVADGLDSEERTQFLGVSQSLAFRFKVSVSLSGSALEDFAGAAEEIQSTGDASLDQFIALMKKLFGEDDESLTHALKMIQKLAQGEGNPDARLKKFMDDMSKLAQARPSGADGQSFRIEVQLEFSFESTDMRIEQTSVRQADPLVLDLDDDGIELTDHTQGARFDITGTGNVAQTAFVSGGDAFLAYDRNGNGRIDDGSELFGDQRGAANGYEELRRLDSNNDGVINADDRDYGKLLLFRDNGDGISQPDELVSLSDAGIAELSLNYANTNHAAAGGNRVAQMASYRRSDGTHGRAADVWLNFVA